MLLRRSIALAAAAPLAATARLVAAMSTTSATADHYDYLVLGGGSGGVASARRAAMSGKKVALVERGPEWDNNGNRCGAGYGGTCVNVGCVPKKLMYTAATFIEAAEEAAGYGVEHSAPPSINWSKLVQRRNAYVEKLIRSTSVIWTVLASSAWLARLASSALERLKFGSRPRRLAADRAHARWRADGA